MVTKLKRITIAYVPRAFAIVLLLLNCSFSYGQIGEPYQISGNIVPLGDVAFGYKTSPDGKYVVYTADQDVDGRNELYSVRITGGAPVKLNPELLNGETVFQTIQISPDSQRIIYLSDNNLYSVSITGGTAIKLNTNLAAGEGVDFRYQISPDNRWVVYRVLQQVNTVKVYSVSLTGSLPILLGSHPRTIGGSSAGSLTRIRISPDSQQVVYLIQNGDFKLFTVPIIGGVPIQLGSNIRGENLPFLRISRDSNRVIYISSQGVSNANELYSAPIIGGSSIKLNPTLVDNGEVFTFKISPDSQRVVYLADQDTDSVNELSSVLTLGGGYIKLNPALVAEGGVKSDYQISPDSQKVIYRADQDINEIEELYSVPIVGGSLGALQLNTNLTAGGDVTHFQISPDGKRIFYSADQDTDDTFELYATPLPGSGVAGGTPIKLSTTPIAGGNVSSYKVSPDNQRVIYRADQDVDEVFEIYSVPSAGGAITKLNANLPFSANVNSYRISQNGAFVIYRADQNVFDKFELFAHQLKDVEINFDDDDQLCVPIKASNGNIALICL